MRGKFPNGRRRFGAAAFGALAVTGLVHFLAAGAPAHAQDLPEGEPVQVIDAWCQAEGGAGINCSCARDAFAENVASRASVPAVAWFAALAQAGRSGDRSAMMRVGEALSPGEMQEAARLLVAAKPPLEACMDLKAPEERADLPQGDAPRDRFVRQCASEGNAEVCGCIADQVQEQLSPFEFELLVDIQAAEAEGKEPLKAVGEDRGLTEEEVKEGLAPLGGRIAGAMANVDPMACVGGML